MFLINNKILLSNLRNWNGVLLFETKFLMLYYAAVLKREKALIMPSMGTVMIAGNSIRYYLNL